MSDMNLLRTLRWFPLRAAQSQHPNVYKHYKFHSWMQCELMLFDTNHIPHLQALSTEFFFQQLHWFDTELESFFITWYENDRSINFRPLLIFNGACFKTLNYLMKVFVKCLHFVNSYMKQNKKRKCAVRTGNHPYRACDILNSLKILTLWVWYILKQRLVIKN